ncbi:tetratricopeptide repeat protein [Kribbella antibiotica]|uniref:Tetratricopeptide repeat protein n=1 Tax=Kribbella antibiotica TaxID=190195 RepID=A0A4R4ZS61_9ACTN|nr:BTAD domain-containing putative transcriptional regulator [Kribbella antibiotica]TDD61898.1 tetratricopeptide repeat protein [Kribbella antibiotica]
MGSALSVHLLGEVRMFAAGSKIPLGTVGQQSLFAALALRANTTVSKSEISEALWGEAPPAAAEGTIYTYVSRLRKAIGNPRLLAGTRRGYTLVLPPDAVDVEGFERAAESAQQHALRGDLAGTLHQSELAMSRWSGAALAGASGPFVERERARLALAKVDLQELRCHALLETGAVSQAVAALSALTEEYPLRERLHELLMLALAKDGRQAEALETYRRVRCQLVTQLGIEPGPGLRKIQTSVLTGDELTPPTRAAWPIPAQLPHAVADFIGRENELKRLNEATTGEAASRSLIIAAIEGAAGVGKTALAVRFAHELAGSFPDGQLFLNLRGFDPHHSPTATEDALGHLLRALGADPAASRGDLAEQSALYRSLLAGKRVLLVLDNAVSADQVRPLLPGTPGSLAVVTSRNRLSGLVAVNGAIRVRLDVLPNEESVELLHRIFSAHQVGATTDSLEQLADLCGQLPLALRIAAEQFTCQMGELEDFLTELRVEHQRLDLLSRSDDRLMAIRSVLSLSYHGLTPCAARTFRLLGLHPGVDFSTGVVAALLGTTVEVAAQQLGLLIQWHLLEQVSRDRYRLHDLVRIYAADCAFADEPPAEVAAAVTRSIDWYLASALAARDVLAPGLGRIDVVLPAFESPPRSFADYKDAVTWVGLELPTLADMVQLAVVRGLHESATQLVTCLGALYHCTSRWPEWLRVIAIGQTAAERTGDRMAQGRLHNDSGVANYHLGHQREAIAGHEAAVKIFTALDDQDNPAVAANLAVAYSMLGRQLDALPLLEHAMKIAEAHGSTFVVASVANGLGSVYSSLDRHPEAIVQGQRGVALVRATGHEHMLAHGLHQLGKSCLRAGHYEDAIAHFREALDIRRALGDSWGEAISRHALASARQQVLG